jgi:hypothetical protein
VEDSFESAYERAFWVLWENGSWLKSAPCLSFDLEKMEADGVEGQSWLY